MTPEWVLILVAVIAALGGAAMGALINQRGASQLANIAWQRESGRIEGEQAREDRYRLFDRRREAYADLYLTIGSMRRRLGMLSLDPKSKSRREEARDARQAYWEKYVVVRLIGSDRILNVSDQYLFLFDESLKQEVFDSASFDTMLVTFNGLLLEFTETARRQLEASDRPE